MDKKILEILVNKGYSQRQIADELNLSQSGVVYQLKKYKLRTIKSLSKVSDKPKKYIICKSCGKKLEVKRWKFRQFCNSKCSNSFAHKEYIKRWKQGKEDGGTGKGKEALSGHIRRYLLKKNDYKCGKCGWSEINPFTKRIPLTINHIDGNYLNNKEENLELICPNCHALTPNYGSLNKGKGRFFERERKRKIAEV